MNNTNEQPIRHGIVSMDEVAGVEGGVLRWKRGTRISKGVYEYTFVPPTSNVTINVWLHQEHGWPVLIETLEAPQE